MVEKETLHKAQLRMIDILQEIDRICTKHQIQWWLFYGTLLGAVRHKGFIPWDDDCDICMLREDYEKFMSVAPKELGNQFFLQTKSTDPKYPKNLTKIRLNDTKLIELDEEENAGFHQGIFVDIFIWDYYDNVSKPLLKAFQIMPNLRQKRKKYPRGSIMRALVGVLTAIPYVFHSLGEKLFKLYCNRTCKNSKLPYLGTEVRLSDGFVVPSQYVLPVKRELEFEGVVFPTPNNSHECLSIIFGDYMQMPPPEKRHIHAKMIQL